MSALRAAADSTETAYGDGRQSESAASRAGEAAAAFGRDRDVAEVEAIRDHLESVAATLVAVHVTVGEQLQRAVALSSIGSPTSSAGAADRSAVPATPASGWSDHVGAPPVTSIHLPDTRLGHILDGDEFGGGHRYGTGMLDKTEFPRRWSDATVAAFVTSTARNPDTAAFIPAYRGRPDQWHCRGEHDGVRIVVVVRTDGRVWAAWPKSGGRGVVKNRRRKRRD